jgi:hypothetical protein
VVDFLSLDVCFVADFPQFINTLFITPCMHSFRFNDTYSKSNKNPLLYTARAFGQVFLCPISQSLISSLSNAQNSIYELLRLIKPQSNISLSPSPLNIRCTAKMGGGGGAREGRFFSLSLDFF